MHIVCDCISMHNLMVNLQVYGHKLTYNHSSVLRDALLIGTGDTIFRFSSALEPASCACRVLLPDPAGVHRPLPSSGHHDSWRGLTQPAYQSRMCCAQNHSKCCVAGF